MKSRTSHRVRNSVLLVLFLFAGVVAANSSLNVWPVPYGANLGWPLNLTATPVSRAQNAGVLKSVLEVFDPSLRPFLTSVPIVLDITATTARAYQTQGYIGVSPDWDNTVLQSRYREIYEPRGMKPGDPVFVDRFKTNLLIHEFLHILQAHQNIDRRSFFAAASRWYLDPHYGIPSPDGVVRADTAMAGIRAPLAVNRMKYVLWHQLYNRRDLNDVPKDDSWKDMHYSERYVSADSGVEEFAYIGEEILASGSGDENYIKTNQWCDRDWMEKRRRLLEVSPEVLAFYRGVFDPKVMQ
jgi:hypothetical protein